ncbi:hypothetical protein JB92DRAFT_2998388 [Gautieria morchelliformis]|nr:hypothetical protein JB92DRAFT_2998388 [Gautieria morchelliformis]
MSTTSPLPEVSPTATSLPGDPGQTTRPRPMHPVVAFIIGLSIILGASLMNAGGLNLTKLDHSRQAALPKSSRRRDWLRPLWLLGMLLYILSQLVGSTLALEFMRAEYVAPLGSTALIFNFLFASILIGTPVTSTDIYGTVIIVFGVIGIVLFGSINSGLENEMDIARLSALWARAGWLAFFLLMSVTLSVLYICTSQLDAVLSARSDLDLPSEPFAASGSGARQQPPGPVSYLGAVALKYNATLVWIREWIEHWTAAKGDKQIAWTLGIGWACCGGGLAGGCLVFAKSGVKLISGSLSHQNTGNQFGHPAAIITFILLGVTAVFQIICLNRGLRVYDSTLVVPVFYGVYTASGFLNSLIFNDQVDAYASWDLFLIFLSIAVLIGGVVLLTNKKPEKPQQQQQPGMGLATLPARIRKNKDGKGAEGDLEALRPMDPGEDEMVWQLGEDSDEEGGHDDAMHVQGGGVPRPRRRESHRGTDDGESSRQSGARDERTGLMHEGDEEDDEVVSGSSGSTRVAREDEFGDWNHTDRTR